MRASLPVPVVIATVAIPLFAAPLTAGPLAPIWAGAYAGIDGGYVAEGFAIAGSTQDVAASAMLGGAHAGYNFQVGFLVAGIEADAMLTRGATKDIVSGFTVTADPTWLASVRARAGFTFANLLIYGTGGYAYLNGAVKARINGAVAASADFSADGFVAGGGIEARVFPGVSLRLEGLHYMGGNGHIDLNASGAGFALGGLDAPGFSVVRAGISFQLN